MSFEDLDKEVLEPKPQSINVSIPFKLMGRVDLSWDKRGSQNSEMQNRHFLLFLKIEASKKVHFMGEFVSQAFYAVDYQKNDKLKFTFGKIRVPFGNPRSYHSYYGGVQGYGSQGVMLPNLWAEPGVSVQVGGRSNTFELYSVNAVTASSSTADVDMQSSATDRRAVGLRSWNRLGASGSYFVASVYGADYWPGRPLRMGGLDFYTDYGSFLGPHFRWGMGVARAWVESAPTSGGKKFTKTGDFYELATNSFDPIEFRLRYGSYENDSRVDTVKDTQSLNVGALFPVDVLRVLVEYQWNYEEVNETNNDVARAMVSLDF